MDKLNDETRLAINKYIKEMCLTQHAVKISAIMKNGGLRSKNLSYLYIDENNIIEISSDDELRNILLRFRMETLHINLLTTLIAHTGNILSLGISSDACYVMYTPVSNNPRYYSSLGNSIISNETIEFSYAGHSTEIPKHKIISFDSLLNVAIEFYLTGERPLTIIEWIED